MDSLVQANEGLKIHNKSLEWDVVDWDGMIEETRLIWRPCVGIMIGFCRWGCAYHGQVN